MTTDILRTSNVPASNKCLNDASDIDSTQQYTRYRVHKVHKVHHKLSSHKGHAIFSFPTVGSLPNNHYDTAVSNCVSSDRHRNYLTLGKDSSRPSALDLPYLPSLPPESTIPLSPNVRADTQGRRSVPFLPGNAGWLPSHTSSRHCGSHKSSYEQGSDRIGEYVLRKEKDMTTFLRSYLPLPS